MLQYKPNNNIKIDLPQYMNFLQLLFLEFLVILLEFTDLVYAIMIDLLGQILWNLHLLRFEKLFHYLVTFS